MEKKTKKLQLRKETIAVLNGERMSHVVGGFIQECNSDEHCPGAERCLKGPDGNLVCRAPMDGESGLPTFQGECTTGCTDEILCTMLDACTNGACTRRGCKQ